MLFSIEYITETDLLDPDFFNNKVGKFICLRKDKVTAIDNTSNPIKIKHFACEEAAVLFLMGVNIRVSKDSLGRVIIYPAAAVRTLSR